MGISHEVFKKEVREYRERTGCTLRDVAKNLGLAHSTLHLYLYAPARLPSLKVVTKAAKLFGCRVSKFIEEVE